MKVSIITSCFNREATIGQAIESVLSQDYPDIEYIVVDGASKDGSLQVINRYKDRITKIISEPDKSMYEGINKGVQAATGDIIGLLHSDDFLFDRYVISDIVRKFSETGAELVYGNGLFVDFEHTDRPVRDWISGNYRKWKVKCGWLPLHPSRQSRSPHCRDLSHLKSSLSAYHLQQSADLFLHHSRMYLHHEG
jgi:glycosyltransferase involved in cell wall biosynthesis